MFLSYASPDAAVANQVCEYLESHGVSCWMAPRDVKPGAAYADAIVRAINEASALVLVLSASAMASEHVSREVERAASKHKQVVAFRVDATHLSAELEYFLSRSQWIDVPALGMAGALNKLVEAVGQGGTAAHANPRLRGGGAGRSSINQAVGTASVAKRVVVAAAVVVVLGVGGMLAVRFWQSKHAEVQAPAVAAISDKSIAVLPFADLSEKHDQEYFADGLAEEVLALLATLPDLKVIGRTSSFQFKSQSADLRAIGNQLGVAYVVEGSVRRYGNRVRVTAQLVQTRDGVHRWSESYDQEVGDILRVQQDIAASLGRALQIEVGGASWQTATNLRSEESYTAYLRGEHALSRYNKAGFEEAVSHFEHALALDPTLVRAREGLALAHFLQYAFGFVSPMVGAEAARQDVDSVLRDNPRSAEGHALRARLLTTYDWDWAGAQKEADMALSLDRNSSSAWYAAADLAFVLGRFVEAERLFRNALSVNPLDSDNRTELGVTLYVAGDLAEAEAELRRVLEIRPSYVSAHYFLAVILLARGKAQAALQEIEQEAVEGGQLIGLATVYYALGRKAESDAALSRAERDVATQGPYLIAQTHAFRHETDAAFQWLDRAYKEKDFSLQYIKGEPFFKNVANDPRFKALLKRMNLLE
ncbi:MAG: TIR domain-containing protein [Steroidobacteraceae bacterium]